LRPRPPSFLKGHYSKKKKKAVEAKVSEIKVEDQDRFKMGLACPRYGQAPDMGGPWDGRATKIGGLPRLVGPLDGQATVRWAGHREMGG